MLHLAQPDEVEPAPCERVALEREELETERDLAREDELAPAQAQLARTEGVWAGPTGVAALAVLARLVSGREVDPDQTFCVIVTETGLKTEAAPPARAGIAFDAASLESLVEERLRR